MKAFIIRGAICFGLTISTFAEKLKEYEQELLKAKTAEEQARIEAKEMEIKYDTMRNYFKEAEVDLHR